MVSVPSAGAFSPLPELIAQFGLPNPLGFLDQSQNSLEEASRASTDWRTIVGDLRGAKEELSTAVSSMNWQGRAGGAMRKDVGDDLEDLERRIEELENSADSTDDGGKLVIDIIKTILIILTIGVTIIAVLFAIAMAASTWTFGSSLLVWISTATGLSLEMVIAITGAVAGGLAILAGITDLVGTWLV